MTRKTIAAALALAAAGVLAAAAAWLTGAGDAAAGACGGSLALRAPPGAKTPTNAALLFTGYTYGTPVVRVTNGGKSLAVTIDSWPSEGGRCGTHFVLVRPAAGAWPAGATLDVDIDGYGKYKPAIGDARDAKPPAGKVGPARSEGFFSSGRLLPYGSLKDDFSPFVLLTFSLKGAPTAEQVAVGPEVLEGLLHFDKSDTCVGVTLTDLAGNVTRFGPEVCR